MNATEKPWWLENRMRLVQTNLRERDARLDVDTLVSRLEDLEANVWLLNTGGISAFYPTDLEYQHQNPHLEGDLLAEAVERCHENDIRLISRFDFSKAHERIFEEKPSWFYRTVDGDPVNYHGIVHTCVNGGYQREYSLGIIDEVLSRYDVDGIFFNMFGYAHWDYDRTYYGICHCENCQRRFRERFDSDLPVAEDPDDPIFQQYQRFQELTVREMLERIRDLVDGYDRDVAVSTYALDHVDVVASESNTSVDDESPPWLYSASDNVTSIEDSFDEKVVNNIAINAVDLPYRFTGVSEHELRIRLYESIASGSGLSFCINGIFEDYPDRTNFDAVREIYRFHAENEAYFGDLSSRARLAVIEPEDATETQRNEYRGVFRMLKEDHRLFDVILRSRLDDDRSVLDGYDLLVFPDVRSISDDLVEDLRDRQRRGTGILATGSSFLFDGHSSALETLFDAQCRESTADTRSSYVAIDDADVFPRSQDRDWVFVDGAFSSLEFDTGVETPLVYVTPGTFGPPERVQHEGNDVTETPGAGVVSRGGVPSVLLPWSVGDLYTQYGFEAHKNVVLDLIDHALADRPPAIVSDAPPTVELFFDGTGADADLLQLLNLSGFTGKTYFEPTPVRNVSVSIPDVDGVTTVRSLTDGVIEWTDDGHDGLTVDLEELQSYEAILLER